jgi:hypothetical protein
MESAFAPGVRVAAAVPPTDCRPPGPAVASLEPAAGGLPASMPGNRAAVRIRSGIQFVLGARWARKRRSSSLKTPIRQNVQQR